MPKGGARNRSGPPIDPTSGRSDARGVNLTALPSEGYTGIVPLFPLPPTGMFDQRESDIWLAAWTTPQAAAWSIEQWRWPIIAEYVRIKAFCESAPNASLIAQLHRYRDQIGLTPAGLKENGWHIAADELAAKVNASTPLDDEAPAPSARRLRAVPDSGAA